MAKYNRQFLVTYLRDICSAEMLCDRLSREYGECRNRVANIESHVNRKVIDPKKPSRSDFEKDSDMGGTIAVIFWIALFIYIGFWLLQWAPVLTIVPFGIAGIMIWGLSSESQAKNDQEGEEYNRAVQRYENQIKANEEHRNSIPQYRRILNGEKQQLAMLNQQLHDAQRLRQSVYDVNIIAFEYRDIRIVYHLYRHFSTCRDSDLDEALKMMHLNEIVQNTSKIVSQNEEIILNLRMKMAMDEQRDHRLAEHKRQELKAFARMEHNQESQMTYQNMIERNQEVTNFFLAADYLRKSK